jgi:hypothetical protein
MTTTLGWSSWRSSPAARASEDRHDVAETARNGKGGDWCKTVGTGEVEEIPSGEAVRTG